ncbi:hypothetical protein EK904_001778 [Melospiza melodia maxima]|nr:hypothetical protein EK904_001778 [Melospiza melodia maxima]
MYSIQEDIQNLKMEQNNLKGNAEAVDICDLRKATDRPELGLRKQAENYSSVIDSQELTLSPAGNKEVNSKEPPKWNPEFGACEQQLVLPRVPPLAVQRSSRAAPRVWNHSLILLHIHGCWVSCASHNALAAVESGFDSRL